jgi:mannose-6-phosphate isomerase-like protein (cupin superfamily)
LRLASPWKEDQDRAEEAPMQPNADPIVLRPGEGQSIDLGNFEMSVLVTGSETGGTFSLLEATEPPNFGPPLHIHHDCAEAFYVLEGEYRIFIEGAVHRCPAGSFILIPSGLRHGFRVGEVPSRKLNLYAPAEMVGYFRDLSKAITSGHADPGRLDDIARRHGMEVVGPVPEGYL